MSFRVIAAALAVVLLSQVPAQAQNLAQSMFGFRPSYRLPFSVPFDPYRPRDLDQDQLRQSHGTYRTMCVRMCDGFYFPISFSAPSGRLAIDADKCRSSCGEDARLFYYPNPGGDIESMIDMTGLAYSSLPNAFKYRKTLVAGCQCKPQPWSETELQRHRTYALDESRLPPPRPGVTTIARLPLPSEPERALPVVPDTRPLAFDPSLRPLTRWATPPPPEAAREPEGFLAPEPIDQDALRQAMPASTALPLESQRRRKRAEPAWPGNPLPRR